jgi:hypothetical protein
MEVCDSAVIKGVGESKAAHYRLARRNGHGRGRVLQGWAAQAEFKTETFISPGAYRYPDTANPKYCGFSDGF